MLTLCMIVRNEEAVLARCLESVASLAEEIVVVDTGSTDATKSIAAGFGATVLDHDFSEVDFAAARNHGLEHARGDFVLVLDADETLDPASVPEVRALVAAGGVVGYVVDRHNHAPGGEQPWLDQLVRLFALRPHIRYRHRVHESIDEAVLESGGALRRSGIVLHHELPAEQERKEKGRRYLELLRADIDPSSQPDRLIHLAAEYHKLEMFTEATAVSEQVALLLPEDFDAQLTAGLYHLFYANDPARARQDLRSALRVRPGDSEALELLAAAEQRLLGT